MPEHDRDALHVDVDHRLPVVDPQVSVFAAGFEDKTRPPVQPAGRLIIRGTAVMAGIEVKN